MEETARGRLNSGRSLLLAGVILAAINLRPATTAIGPLIGEIQADTGLDAAGAGLIAALPVLCFGIFSAMVPRFGRRFGLEEVLLAAMLVLAAGILLRLLPGIPFLFLGTAVLGIAIAFSNVLLPGVTRRSFPREGPRISRMYVAVLGISATLASALAIPLSGTWLGWRGALAVWAVPALVAAVAWAALVRRRPPSRPAPPRVAGLRALLRSRLAVAVMLFMAAQAFAFWIVLTWLTEILISTGIERVDAGLIFAASLGLGVIPIVALSVFGDRVRDDRFLVVAAAASTAAGLLALLAFGSSGAIVWASLIGMGQGASFALGLTFFVSRAASHEMAAELSGTGQSVAYLIAAAGPVLAGVLHDATSSWDPVIGLVLLVIAIQVSIGLEAGRPATVAEGPT
jgi:CP family cyanate transporter-like MFS transporter